MKRRCGYWRGMRRCGIWSWCMRAMRVRQSCGICWSCRLPNLVSRISLCIFCIHCSLSVRLGYGCAIPRSRFCIKCLVCLDIFCCLNIMPSRVVMFSQSYVYLFWLLGLCAGIHILSLMLSWSLYWCWLTLMVWLSVLYYYPNGSIAQSRRSATVVDSIWLGSCHSAHSVQLSSCLFLQPILLRTSAIGMSHRWQSLFQKCFRIWPMRFSHRLHPWSIFGVIDWMLLLFWRWW